MSFSGWLFYVLLGFLGAAFLLSIVEMIAFNVTADEKGDFTVRGHLRRVICGCCGNKSEEYRLAQS